MGSGGSPSGKRHDVIIAGGGPAGLAATIACARAGLAVAVFERRSIPYDKPCGEGVMPAAVRALEKLGVRHLIDPSRSKPLRGVCFIQEDGSRAEACLPAPGGLGVRRTALVEALKRGAVESGAEIHEQCSVLGYRTHRDAVEVDTSAGVVTGSILVAADGLGSPLRAASGLERATSGPRRFGMRQHFQVRPWSETVEVYFADGFEAYVTPVGEQCVGVAFLWTQTRAPCRASFDGFLDRVPGLAAHLRGSRPDSLLRGAGPMLRSVRARVTDRFALLGDAGGYVDAITGEGLSLAFESALALGRILPGAIARGATRQALGDYERQARRQFRRYALATSAFLSIMSRPRLRRIAVSAMALSPSLFERLLTFTVAQ